MGDTLIKFAGDAELGGVGCISEGIIRTQNDLEKLNGEPDISKNEIQWKQMQSAALKEKSNVQIQAKKYLSG